MDHSGTIAPIILLEVCFIRKLWLQPFMFYGTCDNPETFLVPFNDPNFTGENKQQ